MSHEIVAALADTGLPLCRTLTEMLNEHMSHCTERRGCGYTQATRYLSTAINQPRSPTTSSDLSVFANWPQQATESLATQLVNAGWVQGWRGVHEAPAEMLGKVADDALLSALKTLVPRVRAVREKMTFVESGLFLGLLEDLLSGNGRNAPEVAGMTEKPEIGSCSQAEEFFLEISHRRIRRGGSVNIIVDAQGRPLIVEKMHLGESHSGMVVSPVRIFGVWIPPGGLCALKYSDNLHCERQTPHGKVIRLSDIDQARFLRLTTMAVPPTARKRAFGQQFKSQLRLNMLSPLETTIEQLHQFATDELAGV